MIMVFRNNDFQKIMIFRHHGFKLFTLHILFLRKLVDDMLYQKEGVNRKWKTCNPGKRAATPERYKRVTIMMMNRYIVIII